MKKRPIIAYARALILLAVTTAACSGAGSDQDTKAAEPAPVPETPEGYRAESTRLRREGMHKEAAAAALKAFTLARTGPRVDEIIELAKVYGASGNSAGAINEIKGLENKKREEGLPVDEVAIAEVYAQIGDPNAVFRWLTRAIPAKSPKLQGIENNPDLEPVKSDPRWQQFLSSLPKE